MSGSNGIYKEKEFTYKDYRCVINFRSLGFRTGYVEVPAEHPLYGIDGDRLDIDCHGGITWASDELPGSTENESDSWWIGFDCAHYADGEDLEAIKKYFSNDDEAMHLLQLKLDMQKKFPHSYDDHIWSLEEVEDECKHIVDQLIEEKEGLELYH